MAAIDPYGNVVDLRGRGPAGSPLVAVSAERQAAGTVSAEEAIVTRMWLGDGRALPLWRADSVRQRYLPGTNVLRTVARLDDREAIFVRRAGGQGAAGADRRWLARALPLGPGTPRWAWAMYRRSLLVLRALTDLRTGAVAAGARDGWAYVWPRDAAATAIALAAAGYRGEARRIARFLAKLDLGVAARFDGTGEPVPGRPAQGDAVGWVAAAARAVGLRQPSRSNAWRGLADYQEGDRGDYLGNALAARSVRRAGRDRVAPRFETRRGLVRVAGDPASGLDSAAAWAVRPFALSGLYPAARRTLLRLATEGESRFGLLPAESWHGGDDPWTAPTAWSAWSLAALWRTDRSAGRRRMAATDRRAALHLLADLRRAATPLGLLPERVDARTGAPTSTTPLAWSHAFAILAIRQLYGDRDRHQPSDSR